MNPNDSTWSGSTLAVAHLAYAALLLGGPVTDMSAGRLGAAAGLVPVVATIAGAVWPRTGALRGPAPLYAAIIAAMGVAALASAVPGAGIAAALFVLSDALLTIELFLTRADSPWCPAAGCAVLGSYWLAQGLFLLAFQPG